MAARGHLHGNCSVVNTALTAGPFPDFLPHSGQQGKTSHATPLNIPPPFCWAPRSPRRPAFAQTAGNAGPAEIPATRDAPFSLPGEATPTPPLQIDSSTLSRGPAALDPAAALDSMGTETLNATARTESKPASEGLRAIIEQETKPAPRPPAPIASWSAPMTASRSPTPRAIPIASSAGSGRRRRTIPGRPARQRSSVPTPSSPPPIASTSTKRTAG